MDHEQETADTPTADGITAGRPSPTPPAAADTEDESALEPHIVRGLD